MKTIVCIALSVIFVGAEPPLYKQARFRPEKQETEKEPIGPIQNEAPYPAAGYRPSKDFHLPSHQEYPPATSYGVPDDSYGVPLYTYTFIAPRTEYEIPKHGEIKEEDIKKEKKDEKKDKIEEKKEMKAEEKKEKEPKNEKFEEVHKKETEVFSNQGAYYVLLPDFQLQRVQFQTENDVRNMAYTARVQFKNEERAPVFVYTASPAAAPVPTYGTPTYVQLV